MRYAIISDIHSNLEAFDAVEKDLQKEGAEVLYDSDIVGKREEARIGLRARQLMAP